MTKTVCVIIDCSFLLCLSKLIVLLMTVFFALIVYLQCAYIIYVTQLSVQEKLNMLSVFNQ